MPESQVLGKQYQQTQLLSNFDVSRVQQCIGKRVFVVCVICVQSMAIKVPHVCDIYIYFLKLHIDCLGEHLSSSNIIDSCMKILWHHFERVCPLDCFLELQANVHLLRKVILSPFITV